MEISSLSRAVPILLSLFVGETKSRIKIQHTLYSEAGAHVIFRNNTSELLFRRISVDFSSVKRLPPTPALPRFLRALPSALSAEGAGGVSPSISGNRQTNLPRTQGEHPPRYNSYGQVVARTDVRSRPSVREVEWVFP